MTKRHFQAFAEYIKTDLENSKHGSPVEQKRIRIGAQYAADTFAAVAQRYNDRFDSERFMIACGLRGAK